MAPQVARRQHVFGFNEVTEKKRNPFLHFLSFMNNPLSWVMEAAAILAIGATYGGYPTGPPDWEDFVG